jgi:hypothetical protein
MEESAHKWLLIRGGASRNVRPSPNKNGTTTTATAKKRTPAQTPTDAAGASKRRRKIIKKKNAFEVMMENAKIPGIFECPNTKLLLEGCQSMANLVRVAVASTKEKANNKRDDIDDNDDDYDDEDDSDDGSDEYEHDDVLGVEDFHVYEKSHEIRNMGNDRHDKILHEHDKANTKKVFDEVVFAASSCASMQMTDEFDDDDSRKNNQHPGEGTCPTAQK